MRAYALASASRGVDAFGRPIQYGNESKRIRADEHIHCDDYFRSTLDYSIWVGDFKGRARTDWQADRASNATAGERELNCAA